MNLLDQRTLVIFTSDNGPWHELLIYLPFLLQDPRQQTGSADPLRGAKRNSWEGGFRVPAIMRWPGHIPAGQVSDAVVAAIDLFPTIAYLADAAIPTDRIIDGEDIWSILSGQSDGSEHAPFFYDIGALMFYSPGSIRKGKWKLRDGKLYDLETDIHEDTDVADLHPLVKQELEQLYADKLAEIEATRRPYGGTR